MTIINPNNNNQNIFKNSVLNNNNLYHTQRNSKYTSIPFNILIKQIVILMKKINKQIQKTLIIL